MEGKQQCDIGEFLGHIAKYIKSPFYVYVQRCMYVRISMYVVYIYVHMSRKLASNNSNCNILRSSQKNRYFDFTTRISPPLSPVSLESNILYWAIFADARQLPTTEV